MSMAQAGALQARPQAQKAARNWYARPSTPEQWDAWWASCRAVMARVAPPPPTAAQIAGWRETWRWLLAPLTPDEAANIATGRWRLREPDVCSEAAEELALFEAEQPDDTDDEGEDDTIPLPAAIAH